MILSVVVVATCTWQLETTGGQWRSWGSMAGWTGNLQQAPMLMEACRCTDCVVEMNERTPSSILLVLVTVPMILACMCRLTSLFHELPKSESDVLSSCAEYFKKLGQPLIAVEVYEKLGDNWATISLYVDLKQWDMVCGE